SDALGLPTLATVRSWASVGVDPAITGLAPVDAIPKALARAGLSTSDVDLFEINEAFAAMCVATIKLLDLDPDKVNVSGSGCSLGHPVAATGARMLVTLVHELRRRGGGIGVAAMCAGGGMGSATVLEVLASIGPSSVRVIGITGPPGAGKSTTIAALVGAYRERGRRVAVLAVDPA